MLLSSLSHFLNRLASIIDSFQGWLLYLCFSVINYMAGQGSTVALVIAVTLIDAVWGIAVSVHQGKFTYSELGRLTIAKLAVYGCSLFVFIGLDRLIDSTITTPIVGAAIILVEFWSSCASMLILFPNFLFLRLLKKALIGEIASKLKISENDAKEIFEEQDNK